MSRLAGIRQSTLFLRSCDLIATAAPLRSGRQSGYVFIAVPRYIPISDLDREIVEVAGCTEGARNERLQSYLGLVAIEFGRELEVSQAGPGPLLKAPLSAHHKQTRAPAKTRHKPHAPGHRPLRPARSIPTRFATNHPEPRYGDQTTERLPKSPGLQGDRAAESRVRRSPNITYLRAVGVNLVP